MINCQLCGREIGELFDSGLIISDIGADIMGETDQVMPYPAYRNWSRLWQHVSCESGW